VVSGQESLAFLALDYTMCFRHDLFGVPLSGLWREPRSINITSSLHIIFENQSAQRHQKSLNILMQAIIAIKRIAEY
jgi:hypothetical protein